MIDTIWLAQSGLSSLLGTIHPQSEPWWQALVSGSPGLSPGQVPALGPQKTGASDGSYGSPSYKFEAFVDAQIRINGSRLVRVSQRKFGPVDTILMQITNQGPRERPTAHQKPSFWTERQLPVHPKERYPSLRPWPGFQSVPKSIATSITMAVRTNNEYSLGIAHSKSTSLG